MLKNKDQIKSSHKRNKLPSDGLQHFYAHKHIKKYKEEKRTYAITQGMYIKRKDVQHHYNKLKDISQQSKSHLKTLLLKTHTIVQENPIDIISIFLCSAMRKK